jgi:hypothetical protein
MRNAPGDRVFGLALWGAALGVAAVFAWLFADLARLGLGALSWDFVTTAPENAGRAGGIAPILVSTLLILAVAVGVAAPGAVQGGASGWRSTGWPACRRSSSACSATHSSACFSVWGSPSCRADSRSPR